MSVPDVAGELRGKPKRLAHPAAVHACSIPATAAMWSSWTLARCQISHPIELACESRRAFNSSLSYAVQHLLVRSRGSVRMHLSASRHFSCVTSLWHKGAATSRRWPPGDFVAPWAASPKAEPLVRIQVLTCKPQSCRLTLESMSFRRDREAPPRPRARPGAELTFPVRNLAADPSKPFKSAGGRALLALAVGCCQPLDMTTSPTFRSGRRSARRAARRAACQAHRRLRPRWCVGQVLNRKLSGGPDAAHPMDAAAGWSGCRAQIDALGARPVWVPAAGRTEDRLAKRPGTAGDVASDVIGVVMLSVHGCHCRSGEDKVLEAGSKPLDLGLDPPGHVYSRSPRDMAVGPERLLTRRSSGRVDDTGLDDKAIRAIRMATCGDVRLAAGDLCKAAPDVHRTGPPA